MTPLSAYLRWHPSSTACTVQPSPPSRGSAHSGMSRRSAGKYYTPHTWSFRSASASGHALPRVDGSDIAGLSVWRPHDRRSLVEVFRPHFPKTGWKRASKMVEIEPGSGACESADLRALVEIPGRQLGMSSPAVDCEWPHRASCLRRHRSWLRVGPGPPPDYRVLLRRTIVLTV